MRKIGDLAANLFAHILPVDKKCVYVYNILDGYNDSVKYVVEELHRHHPEYQIIWDCAQSMTMKDVPSYITQVRRGSSEAAYYQARAFLCLDSYIGLYTWLYQKRDTRKRIAAKLKLKMRKRSGQIHISTFHGVVYKYIGAKRYGEHVKDYAFTTSCDYLILGNRFEEPIYQEAYPGEYQFRFLGKANTDILFDTERKNSLKQKLKLPVDKKLFLYAPTFRDWCVEDGGLTQMRQINLPELLDLLQKKFGGEWVFGFRVHHYVQEQMESDAFVLSNEGTIINCNQHDDMAEYMSCCDAFMTDYSSSVLDVMQTEKPCFLYANDEKEYMEKRGGLYFSLHDFPYPIVRNKQELLDAVRSYDRKSIDSNRKAFLERIGNVSDGHSAARIVDFIDSITQK